MKIYTKTGDDGTTSLYGGRRVSKSDLQIESFGTIDELNCYIGLIADTDHNTQRVAFLRNIQSSLFDIGAILAADASKPHLKLPQLQPNEIALLEQNIDQMTEELPVQRYFILPGGHPTVSYCHLARTVCRRAERTIVALREHGGNVPDIILQYINRLSDYLFVLARYKGKEANVEEIYWIPKKE
ncbi:MAG: cob(I)yrinic acid a,c-diamide adenosyltransferase [Cytophagales bacterium]|nr:cob(I)yrinic acid a,c-diamide adenosyltransferase [Cytophagales bacterium]MDW8383751.1 cob(I)yrinic acid a,c-diamide adenosyltransferase [Flammeovirgaceae bacterium]